MKNTFIFSLSLFLIISCKKEKIEEYAHITGKVVKDCNGEPCVNCPIRITIDGGDFKWGGGESRTLTRYTDSLGNFGISSPKDGDYTSISLSSSRSIVFENVDQDVGTVIRRPTANYVLRIVIPPQFLNTDTLYFPTTFERYKYAKIPCSVRDTILPAIYDFYSTSHARFDRINLISPLNKGLYYRVFRKDSTGALRNVYIENNDAVIEIDGCTSRLDSVTVNINPPYTG